MCDRTFAMLGYALASPAKEMEPLIERLRSQVEEWASPFDCYSVAVKELQEKAEQVDSRI